MRNSDGRITFFTVAIGAAAVFLVFFNPLRFLNLGLMHTSAGTATTTVTVLNTPPLWTVDAQTSPASNTSTPTNAGSAVTWIGTATSPNNNSYYLLICKTSSTPTANNSAAPTCGGGAGNQWAVSLLTTSTIQATSTYVTTSTNPQFNAWFAWICDNDPFNAACNGTFKQGSGSSASPFVVNHWPIFSSFTNNSPANPGAAVTWSSNASDTDNFTGATDTVKIYVCKANDFTGSVCGAGGTYCSSSLALTNPSCSSTLADPFPNGIYNSYGFVLDQHGFAAVGGSEGTVSTFTVNEVAPTIASSSISLNNNNTSSVNLILTNPGGQTTGFTAKFTVRDDNSCMTQSGGNQLVATSTIVNVYLSSIGSAGCKTSGQYNPNNCYPSAVGTTTWNYSCTADVACAGTSTLTQNFTCTFPLQYLTDPTDTSTPFTGQTWFPSVSIFDVTGVSSSLVQAQTGNTVSSFLAYNLNTNSISYGSLASGSSTPLLSATTSVSSVGNTGVDETLYGVSMCTTYPSCPVSTTSTIPVGQQQYGTSSLAYGTSTAVALLANPGALLAIHIPKSTVVAAAASGTTFWGIAVPGTIQLAGNYTGQDTIIGAVSTSTFW